MHFILAPEKYISKLGNLGEDEILINIDGENIKVPLLTAPDNITPMIQLTEAPEYTSTLQSQ